MDSRISTLLRWYRTHKRALPWRNESFGLALLSYRIFISEIMLQQTQVDRVIPKWKAWMKQFPTWKKLADSKTADVIHAWSGLGYNRRALQTREAAKHVVEHGIPRTEDGWKKLKGVGPYTAAALTEFVNHARAIVIDTNVRRVAGRVFLGKPFPDQSHDHAIMRSLERVVPHHGRHWDIPQALMDLGSAVCVSGIPDCRRCPLHKMCLAAPRFTSTTTLRRPARINTERHHLDKKYPDRIYRGRMLAWIRERGTTSLAQLGPKIDPEYNDKKDADWVKNMAERLVRDGLLTWTAKNFLKLP